MSTRRKVNVTRQNVEDYLPSGITLKVRHLHPGNSSPEERRVLSNHRGTGRPPKYVTVATVIRRIDGVPLVTDVASCSPRDNPRRLLGHRIAAGRAVSQYLEQYG